MNMAEASWEPDHPFLPTLPDDLDAYSSFQASLAWILLLGLHVK